MKKKSLASPRWLAAVAILAVAACGSSHASSAPPSHAVRAAVSRAAANPTVKADLGQASLLVKGCEHQHPGSLSGTEACLEARVPKARRHVLGKCLVTIYMADLKHAGGKSARVRVHNAWAAFTASDIPGIGAQPCVRTALGQ
jgi:hypothetical protein